MTVSGLAPVASAILIDDSGSMLSSDPDRQRAAAVPELLVCDAEGSRAYAAWIRASVAIDAAG